MSFLKQALSLENSVVNITTEELLDSFEAVYSAESALTTYGMQSEQLLSVLNKVEEINQLSLESALTDKEYGIAMSVATDGVFDELSMEASGDEKKKTIWQRILAALEAARKWFLEKWKNFTNWVERTGEKIAVSLTKLSDEELKKIQDDLSDLKENSGVALYDMMILPILKKKDSKLYNEFKPKLNALLNLDPTDFEAVTKATEEYNEVMVRVSDVMKEAKTTDILKTLFSKSEYKKAVEESVHMAKIMKRALVQSQKAAAEAEKTIKDSNSSEEDKKVVSKFVTSFNTFRTSVSGTVTKFWKAIIAFFNKYAKKDSSKAEKAPEASPAS